MAENKIPVLTEVYQPKEQAKNAKRDSGVIEVTPALIAKLEEEIKQSVLVSLREEVKKDVLPSSEANIEKSQQSIVDATKDYIDKAKADFKTELPALHQQSVNLAGIDLSKRLSSIQSDAVTEFKGSLSDTAKEVSTKAADEAQRDVSAGLVQALKAEMITFKENTVSEHQAELAQSMREQLLRMNEEGEKNLVSSMEIVQAKVLEEQQTQIIQLLDEKVEIYKGNTKSSVEEHTQILDSQLAIHKEYVKNAFEEYMQSFQARALSELKAELNSSLPAILDQLVQNAESTLQEKVDGVQNEMQHAALAQINQNLADAIPNIFEPMMDGIKVKFSNEMSIETEQVRSDLLTELNGELPQVQQILSENVEKILENTIPIVEEALRQKLTADIQELLLKVKFVLP